MISTRHLRGVRPLLTASTLAGALAVGMAVGTVTASAQTTPKERLEATERTYPPWQRGRNNDATNRGVDFTVPPVDVLADFHGSLDRPELVVYASGNYFFAMAGLVRAFGEAYPQYRGRIFYETLPPGVLAQQLEAGGTVTSGNMTWTAKPDVYQVEVGATNELVRQGKLIAPVVTFATNDIAIMVPAGNPAHIASLPDLARPGLALAMPTPAFEGVARQIRASLVKVGGEALAEAVYGTKVRNGEAVLTRIHHRQTPLFLMQHLAEAGVTWKSEAIFQEEVGNPIGHVDIPAEVNTLANYSAAMVKDAPHPETARIWLDFLRTDAAFKAFAPYGFRRYSAP